MGLGRVLAAAESLDTRQLRTLLHELLDEPLRLLGTLIGMVVLCAVLGALRQNGTASGMDEPFSVVAAASALVLLGEPVFGCVERTVQSLRECSLFVMSFAPVLSGILIAGGSPASAGAYNLMLYFVSQLLAELASKTLLPLLGVYLALCILSPLAPFLQVGQLTRAIHRLTCWGLGVLTTHRHPLAANGDRLGRGRHTAENLQISGGQLCRSSAGRCRMQWELPEAACI